MTDIYQVSNYTPCQIGLVKGEDGRDGIDGINGVDGKSGKDGKDGLRGLSGSDGKSNYQLALGSGFVGSVDDYLLSMKGDKGLKGDAGVDAAIDSLTVSTGAAGTSASVVTGGTPTARTFNFTIPRGDKGATGEIALSDIQGTSSSTGISQKGFTNYVTLSSNAASRKVGTVTGSLVERGADGYPTNNNAIGVGQTWQNMTASRRENTVYTNSTGRPIVVLVTFARVSGSDVNCIVNNVNIARISTSDVGETVPVTFIVPTGNTYKLETVSILDIWSELR